MSLKSKRYFDNPFFRVAYAIEGFYWAHWGHPPYVHTLMWRLKRILYRLGNHFYYKNWKENL